MYLPLTENYIAASFFQNCGKPFYNRAQRTYQGSCPICREGKSWLKKRRCYYIVDKNVICCHNCGWYSNPYQWIVKVTNKNFKEIKEELESATNETFINSSITHQPKEQKKNDEILPLDSINLFDRKQITYYKDNLVVRKCIEILVKRNLDKAINRPTALYTTLTDKIHYNRLIIPFYSNNKIIFYQSRSIESDDTRPKYLSKVSAEKSFYGIDNIDSDFEYIFILEGPIDAMFVKNGVGIAGINENSNKNFTKIQEHQLQQYPLHKKIWVLDNQKNDNASKVKTKKLLENNETVFIWPENLSKYKDLNDYCVDMGTSYFDPQIIIDNSYSGLKGKLLVTNY